MIVDDAVLARRIMRNMLTGGGHEIACEVSSGEDALAAYRENQPDVVMMDVTMPGKDGITAAREILQQDARAKVIMVTSVASRAVVERAFTTGVSGYITKPCSSERVLREIEQVLAFGSKETSKPVQDSPSAAETTVPNTP